MFRESGASMPFLGGGKLLVVNWQPFIKLSNNTGANALKLHSF